MKCRLDIKKDISDTVSKMMTEKGAVVVNDIGYFNDAAKASKNINEVNNSFKSIVAEKVNTNSFKINPKDDLVEIYYQEYIRNNKDYSVPVEDMPSKYKEENVKESAPALSTLPKNLTDLYNSNKEIFGLNDKQAFASAVAMDKMIETMAIRAGVSKEDMYDKLRFEKAKKIPIETGIKFQVNAWHGTPYLFDKFRTDKIGQGEGLQAYGWGLYFTELKSIAKSYARAIDAKAFTTTDGKKFTLHEFFEINMISKEMYEAIKDVIAKNPDISSKKELYEKLISESLRKKTIFDFFFGNKISKDDYRKAAFFIERSVASYEKIPKKKNLYNVTLQKGKKINEYQWLEWDRPVPRDIVNKVTKRMYEKENRAVYESYISKVERLLRVDNSLKLTRENIMTGEKFYNIISTAFIKDSWRENDKKASLLLLEQGIDGVKYPVGYFTRTRAKKPVETNAFNYVVFDENAVEINKVLKFQKDAVNAKGAMMINMDGQAVIYAMTDPDVSTPLHELAHVYEHYLTDEERNIIIRNAKTEGWTIETSEYFARGFEKYLSEGISPISELNGIFEQFKKWLLDIYRGIVGSDIDITLNDEMRNIYAMMFEGNKTSSQIKKQENEFIQDKTLFQQVQSQEIKPGVEKLFESNPELANAVYEAVGLKTLENSRLEKDIKELIKDREDIPSSIFLSYLVDNNLIPKIQEYITSIGYRGGEWNELYGRLTLNYSISNTKSEIAKLMSHELMHALSHKYITSYEALRQPDFKEYIDKVNENEKIKGTNRKIELINLTREQVDAFDNLVRIKEKVFDFIKAGKFNKNEKLKNANFGSLNYAFSELDKKEDIHEFISEAFSNPILIDVLKQIPTEGNKSNLFKEFIKALKIILGFNDESIIEDILYYSEKAFINEALKESNTKKQQAQQLYSQYLDTIFPDSKVKDIVYHGTLNKFDKFNRGINGIHFSKDVNVAINKFGNKPPQWLLDNNPDLKKQFEEKEKRTIAAILNINSIDTKKDDFVFNGDREFETEYKRFREKYKNLDAIEYENKFEGGNSNSILVFEPEQIHILGTKQDIEQFKSRVDEFNRKTNIQGAYNFSASSNSGKWNSANNELLSLVENNRKAFAIYKFLIGDMETFKEIVNFLNEKGIEIPYTDRMKRADETMTAEERKSAIDSYNDSVDSKVKDKAQVEKDILSENNLQDETDYTPQELIEKYPLTGVEKVIWNLIKDIVNKLGIKVKFSSSRITEGFDGSNNPLNGEILIRPSTLKNGRFGEVLVHEIVHALTTKIISRVNSGVITGLTQKQINAVKGLMKLFEAVKADNNLENKYPVKDVFEFIAHLTNEAFVKELESKDKSFLQKVVNFIADILGITNANDLAKKYLLDIISDGVFLQENGITVLPSDYGSNIQGSFVEVKSGLTELFDSNPELANAVYETLGFKQNSKFKNSLWRGQAAKPNIDNEGNLILKPSYEELSKDYGKSFTTEESVARSYGNRYSNNPYFIEVDEDYISSNFNLRDEDVEGEKRIIGKNIIKIPKGKFNIINPSIKDYENTDVDTLIKSYINNLGLDNSMDEILFSGGVSALMGINYSPIEVMLNVILKKLKTDYDGLLHYIAEKNEQSLQNLPENYSDYGSSYDFYYFQDNSATTLVYEAMKKYDKNYIPNIITYSEEASFTQPQITSQQKQQAQQLYSQYLDTIFPDSKVKDIVYHGTNKKFDKFDKNFLSKYDVGYYGKGFYFSTKPNKSYSDKNYHKQELDGVMLSVLVNLPNPNYKASNDFSDTGKDVVKDKGVIVIDEDLDNELTEKTKTPEEFVNALLKLGKYDIDQIVVFEPEQIHILGTEQDIEGFRQWMQSQGGKDTTVLDNLISKLEQFGIIEKDCSGRSIKAKDGIRSKFTKGSQWELVKDLKGYPSHAQGGVDIKLGKDGFSFTKNGGQILAAYGLVLPNITSSPGDPPKKRPSWDKYVNQRDPNKDPLLEDVMEIVDPTGVLSWDDVQRSWNDGKFDERDILEPLGALPVVGKFGKFDRLKKGADMFKEAALSKALRVNDAFSKVDNTNSAAENIMSDDSDTTKDSPDFNVLEPWKPVKNKKRVKKESFNERLKEQ